MRERNVIFEVLRGMVEHLVQRVSNERVVGLTESLVLELVQAGYRCPAFNPRMKFCLAYVGNDTNTLARLSEEWLSFFPFDSLNWKGPHNPYVLEVMYTKLQLQV